MSVSSSSTAPGPATDMLACQADAFHLPAGVHYLNGAGESPSLRVVEEAAIAGVRRKRLPSATPQELQMMECDELRALFARLVNAPRPYDVAIIPSVSYGVATAARNVPVSRGQNVVVLHDQFPSNVYAWHRLASERGAEVRTVAPPDHPAWRRAVRWNERLLDAIDARTAVVAIEEVHWTDGTRFDLHAVGARAREVGAAFILDAAQSVGAQPMDVQAIHADAVVCASYKWLLGPTGLGLAYFGARFSGGIPLEEGWLARHGSENYRRLTTYRDEYQPGAIRYDMGERMNGITVPMLVAAIRQLLAWDVARIQRYCATITSGFCERVRSLGWDVEDEAWRAAHVIGIRPPAETDLDALTAALRGRNVIVSARGSALRISPNVYNRSEDLDVLLQLLRDPAPQACA